MIDTAFILAAGLGTRLRPHTEDKPKPMVKVDGVPMIEHAFEKLQAEGVQNYIVNTHYQAHVLHSFLENYSNEHCDLTIERSYEEVLLDTGGGIVKVLDSLPESFFVLSGDSVWDDGASVPMLKGLQHMWDEEKMDILIALQPKENMVLTHGVGDYSLAEDGRAVRSLDKTGDYMFTSVRINAKCIFASAPEGAFSYLQLLDEAQAKGRLYGYVHQGDWHHISTPADLEAVNEHYAHKEEA